MPVEAEGATEVIERNRSEPDSLTRVATPATLLNSCVGPILTRFMLRYLAVKLSIDSTNRRQRAPRRPRYRPARALALREYGYGDGSGGQQPPVSAAPSKYLKQRKVWICFRTLEVRQPILMRPCA
jgi:hypothetical protein